MLTEHLTTHDAPMAGMLHNAGVGGAANLPAPQDEGPEGFHGKISGVTTDTWAETKPCDKSVLTTCWVASTVLVPGQVDPSESINEINAVTEGVPGTTETRGNVTSGGV